MADGFDERTDPLGDRSPAEPASVGTPQTFMPEPTSSPHVPAPAPPTYPQPTYPPPTYGQYLPPQQITYQPPAKSRTGLWITLGTIGAVVLAVVLAFATGVISVHKKSASTAADPGSATGVSYTSPDNHFTAKFPVAPTTATVPSSVGTIKMSIFVARAGTPATVIVDETLTNGTLPPEQDATTLRVGMSSFAAGANASIDSQEATTFRGKPARTGTVTLPTGEKVTATMFVYSTTSVYLLAAEKGAAYDNLVKSFEVLEPGPSS